MPLLKQLWLPIAAMIAVVAVSNYAVQFPINDWLTWGTFTYPLASGHRSVEPRLWSGPRAHRRSRRLRAWPSK